MKIKTGLILGIVVSLIFISARTIFSQEPTEQGGAVPETQNEPEVQWVWGEALSIDAQNKTFVVKYLDYEADQEKEITINVDDKTTYENIKSIDEIKPKDALSIDYIVTPEGKNIAKNISLEKPEATPIPQAGETETTPENLQPVPVLEE